MAEEEKKSRKPKDSAFRQQRLRAWQPVLTPRSVLPTFFIIGVIFAPVGGLLYWASNNVNEIVIDYTNCDENASPVYLPSSAYSIQFSSSDNQNIEPPAYHYQNSTTFLDSTRQNPNNLNISQCIIDFTVPQTMKAPVFINYRLTNFYQNHRQYIKSYNAEQLMGQAVGQGTIDSSCSPLGSSNGKIMYPCGLIANSVYNDTISNLTSVNGNGGAQTYTFDSSNIAWSSDLQKYGKTQYSPSQIVPPPNWALQYPNGQYSDQNPPPDISKDQHLMVWMRTAALPDFRKIWGKNENTDLPAGRWRVFVDSNFDVKKFSGTKSIVITTTSPLGGRNPYLGIAYMSIGAFCFLLGIIFTIRHCIRPRKLGDTSYLSWNKPDGGLPDSGHNLHQE
ncbi:hypothetical protein INT43_004520 [Umbelopsis isabellina]|uniref:Uncharacterized protein n=1 Tax=Mortierella isabellina TaxID=91625 RepID=A0A8H7PFS7_MORIS|nr:hypothetical protein INT43_004520 [Umbelopsis isabellina]